MFALRNSLSRFRVLDHNSIINNARRTVSQAKIDVDRLENIKVPESNSFVQNIFTGVAKVENFFPYPKVLTDEELSFVDMITEPVRKIHELEFDPLEVEKNEEMSPKHLQMLKDLGAFGVQVPHEYGGMGLNNTQYARLGELSAGHDLAVAAFTGAHQAIGYKGLLLYGTPEMKERYLPELAKGDKIAAFALTEASAGSDAAGIKSRAVLSEDGKHYILNGSKIYITNGGIADYFTIFAKTPGVNSRGEPKDKVTAFWVPRCEGLTNGPPMQKMGIKFSNTTELYFDNVKIPVGNVVGEVGEGFKVAMNILNNGRYGMCCALSGLMKNSIVIATKHANNRSQFGNTLASYEGIQEKIARMQCKHYTTQSMAYMLSGLMDKGVTEFHLEAAISKIFASESAWSVVDETLQILGGMGYMREPGVEKMLRDARIFRIFEGTNEILRLLVALTGMQYAGGHLRDIQRAMKNPVGNMGMIFGEGSKRIRRSVGFDAPQIGQFAHRDLEAEAQMLSKHVLNFSSTVEHMLIKYTKDIIHQQMQLMRLADAAIDMYSMLVVISRASRALNKNIDSAEVEKKMAKFICSEANMRIEQKLHSLKAQPALNNDHLLRAIAQDVLTREDIVYDHPLA